ncbi:hypothetical protein AB7360_17325 [Providencia alcalifaciens]|uniref:hypothetical protein n=1 Tax=Providencia alcalifaciens TaxID=126385 RepID=UPI0032DBD0FA
MKNKKLFNYIMMVNNIPDHVFNQRQARIFILTYLFIVVVMVYILNWIGSLLINDLNLPVYVSVIVLAFIIAAIMGVKFNLASKFPDKYERLDKLLSQYKPNNPEAYDHLKNETTENPDNFPVYLEEWIAVEKETYDEYKAKPKHYQFTDSKK